MWVKSKCHDEKYSTDTGYVQVFLNKNVSSYITTVFSETYIHEIFKDSTSEREIDGEFYVQNFFCMYFDLFSII